MFEKQDPSSANAKSISEHARTLRNEWLNPMGLRWGEIREDNLSMFCFFLYFILHFLGFSDLYYSKMANQGTRAFSHFFEGFRELRKLGKNLDPEASYLLQKCFNEYKKNMESPWENIIFVNMGFTN